MAGEREESWDALATSLLERTEVPAAQANADLLRRSAGRWEGRVDARSSMHDLLFTKPGGEYPFDVSARVAWNEGVFEYRLESRGGVVSADRCFEPNSAAVLDAFLVQLVGGEP